MIFKSAAVLATILSLAICQTASAADVSAPAQQTTLAPGGAAGVKHAQMFDGDNALFVVGAAAIIITGVALIASGGNGRGSTTTTTTTTSTTGTN